jgi:predicted ribosome quality control (RQC) complex YloA/Tae2 family protein
MVLFYFSLSLKGQKKERERKRKIKDKRKKMKIERIYFESLHMEIPFIIGTSKEDNFTIIDLGDPKKDIWFHARNISSCHVIAAFSFLEKELPKFSRMEKNKIMKKGAELVKKNTKKLQQEKKIEIIYMPLENNMKTDKIGMVSYTEKGKEQGEKIIII